MGAPARFPSGISTSAPRSVLSTYPALQVPGQSSALDNFMPYRAGDYTISLVGAGVVTPSTPLLGGAIKLATSAAANDSITLLRQGSGFQFTPGRKLWFNCKLALPRTAQGGVASIVYAGLFATAPLAAALDAVYFVKPTGATAVNLVIKKAGVITTIQNVANLGLPSGLFGDANSSHAVLSSTVAGGAFTSVGVASPGAGYAFPPIVLTAGPSGVVANNPVFAGLGSTAFSAGSPSLPVLSTGLPYASVYGTYITTPGSGYTNSTGNTTWLEVEPWIELQLYFDGRSLFIGVNGRVVASLGPDGQTNVAAAGTVNAALANSFFSTTQLSSLVASVQPAVGGAYNLLPQIPLAVGFGIDTTTTSARALFVGKVNAAVDAS